LRISLPDFLGDGKGRIHMTSCPASREDVFQIDSL